MVAGWFPVSLLLVSAGARCPGACDGDSGSLLAISKASSTPLKADTDVQVLQGYSTTKGQRKQTALTGKWKPSGHKDSEARVYISESTEHLEQSLHIEESFSVNYLKDGMKQKLDWYNSLEVDETSITVSVRSWKVSEQKVTNPEEDIGVRDDVEIPTNSAEFEEFFDFYGDMYVDSVDIGGEFLAVYVFHTKTHKEREELKTSLQSNNIISGSLWTPTSAQTWPRRRKQPRCNGRTPPRLSVTTFQSHLPTRWWSSPWLLRG